MAQLAFSSNFYWKICFKFCILEQIIATVLFIRIFSINNKRSCSDFNQQRPPLTGGGLPVVSVSSLVLRGIKLVPTTCFSPQSRRGGSFDLVLAKRILRAEDKSDRVCSSCGRKMKTLHQLYSFVSSALFSSENEKSESEERFKRPATDLKG